MSDGSSDDLARKYTDEVFKAVFKAVLKHSELHEIALAKLGHNSVKLSVLALIKCTFNYMRAYEEAKLGTSDKTEDIFQQLMDLIRELER